MTAIATLTQTAKDVPKGLELLLNQEEFIIKPFNRKF